MKNYLILVDLEGVHGVVGEPYVGLKENTKDYLVSVINAEKEVNSVCKALFEEGADTVYVWDNHGAGRNLDFSRIDSRATKILEPSPALQRLDFLKDKNICGNIFIGYHSREGTLNGVLAHTYDSSCNQYYKFNGKALGEYEMDSILSAEYGIPPIFAAADSECVKQMLEFSPDLVTSITKIGLGRNQAEFIDEEKVLNDIYEGVKRAVKTSHKLPDFKFPCQLEVRYTRTEWAANYYKRNREEYGVDVKYVDNDCHVVSAEIKNTFELKIFF